MAVLVLANKLISYIYNLGSGPIVLLHQENLGAGPILFKIHECFRIRCTKPINRLVFITNHQDVFRFGCEQSQNLMLNFACVLCLIYAEVGVFLLKIV